VISQVGVKALLGREGRESIEEQTIGTLSETMVVSDKRIEMESLAAKIIAYAQGLPEGVPIVPRGALHLGSRAGVDKALSRLTASGQLVRAARGIYLRPVTSRFGTRSPSVELFIEAFAIQQGQAIVPSGASAANRLGLSTQIPGEVVYLTSGRTRYFRFGRRVVELRHAPRWQTSLGMQPAGEVVRALAWLGPKRAAFVVDALRGRIEASTARALLAAQSQFPEWIARCVAEIARG